MPSHQRTASRRSARQQRRPTRPFSNQISQDIVLPPIGKQKRYPALTLTAIYAEERGTPKNRKKIEWRLITDLPVYSRQDVIEKLEWYALRWKIEVFHKILKSGCKAEELKLRTPNDWSI